MFLDKVTEDGIICFHISNRYLDLEPVLGNLCQDAGLIGYVMEDEDRRDKPGQTASTWVAIARKAEYLSRLKTDDWNPLRTRKSVGVWTDDYSNILSVFLRKGDETE
jgi:hypothetical protein